MSESNPTQKTLYLIDGSAYIYRAFFALPALNNSKGFQTNAVYGFMTTLLKIIREHKPDGLAVAFDEKGPTLRHEEFKEYKAQRPPMPDGMKGADSLYSSGGGGAEYPCGQTNRVRSGRPHRHAGSTGGASRLHRRYRHRR